MADGRYKAVVVDLFDTLVKWDPSQLPEVEWRGRRFHSTLPYLEEVLRGRLEGQFDREQWLDAYLGVIGEIVARREQNAIEVTCHERFVRALGRFSAAPADRIQPLAAELARIHMGHVRRVTFAPKQWVEAVKRIAAHYRLGLLSNFDDAETGRMIVGDTGVAHLFETILISAELGHRKPHPAVFEFLLEQLGLEPAEVLFVGDTAREDVLGAHNAGIPVVWLSEKKAGDFPATLPAPDFVIGNIADLPALLGV